MDQNTFRVLFGWALILLVAAQLVGLGLRQWPGFAASRRWLEPGDGLASLEVTDTPGQESRLPMGRPTVLLVFDPHYGP